MRCMCPVGDWRLRRGSAVQSGNASRPQRHVSPLNSRKTLFYTCTVTKTLARLLLLLLVWWHRRNMPRTFHKSTAM